MIKALLKTANGFAARIAFQNMRSNCQKKIAIKGTAAAIKISLIGGVSYKFKMLTI